MTIRNVPAPSSVDRVRDQLIQRQILRWTQQEKQRSDTSVRPSVAFSRLPGAGGAELGKRVASELGFEFFGIELVDEIARIYHVDRERVARLDERMRDVVERFVRDGFTRNPYTENEYHSGLIHTLATIGSHGRAVILGRGSPFVLPPERTLRVLAVAPREFRVERLCQAKGIDRESGARRIAHEEAQRLAFISRHFAVNPDDPSLYDLVVNTGTLGIANAADLVTEALHHRFPRVNEAAPHAAPAISASASA